MLEGRQFFVLTDHKPLCHALGRVSAPWSTRQQRHLSYISEFTQDIRHVSGVNNAAANELSRPLQLSCLAPTDIPPFLNTEALSAAQEACSMTVALASDPRFQVVGRLLASSRVLLCSTSMGMDRLLLPPSFRRCAFDALHALSHPGVRGSHHLLLSRFLWPGMNKDVDAWASSYLDCQRTKVARHVLACSTHRRAFSAFLTRPRRLGGTSAFCSRLHSRVHRGGPFDTLASRLPHPGDLHTCLHRLPLAEDLLFRGY